MSTPDSVSIVQGPTGEGRIARSWRLTKAAWKLVLADDTLKSLALIGALAGIGAFVVILALSGVFGGSRLQGSSFFLWSLVFSYPMTFISVFVNTAIAAAAAAALDGRSLTLREALAVPAGRIGRIAGWALIAAVVGVVLESLARRLPLGGSIAARLVGLGWALATLFAIPVLALEDTSPLQTLRRSAQIVKERWGEGVAGTVIVGAWTVLALLALIVAGVVLIGLTANDTGALILVIAVLAVALVALFAVQSLVRQTFLVALYRYATTGQASGPFSEADLSAPFGRRR